MIDPIEFLIFNEAVSLLNFSITVVWRIFHIGTVTNVCPTLTLKFSVTFVCLTRCVANLLCVESSVANLPCGESSGNPTVLNTVVKISWLQTRKYAPVLCSNLVIVFTVVTAVSGCGEAAWYWSS